MHNIDIATWIISPYFLAKWGIFTGLSPVATGKWPKPHQKPANAREGLGMSPKSSAAHRASRAPPDALAKISSVLYMLGVRPTEIKELRMRFLRLWLIGRDAPDFGNPCHK
jgi:hypothetical protein